MHVLIVLSRHYVSCHPAWPFVIAISRTKDLESKKMEMVIPVNTTLGKHVFQPSSTGSTKAQSGHVNYTFNVLNV